MPTLLTIPSYDEMSRQAADLVADVVRAKPGAVLGLATGSTPIGTYKHLVRMVREGTLDLSRVTTVNLDEYVGLPPSHPQSYRYFMERHLFRPANLAPEQTFLPDGMASDPEAEGRRYDALIESLGGIDLQLLGIGFDGHIGFNEPCDEFVKATHPVDLDPSTIRANARFFASEAEVPRRAITMGIGAILAARRVLLLACGEGKRAIFDAAVYGPITPRLPASILQLHPDATFLFSPGT
ncbi:MAG: glucosamine-6-phosphate deaminase [Kiritimatiellia bacterium]|jgi:glucosamine-6-phosphate deaminase